MNSEPQGKCHCTDEGYGPGALIRVLRDGAPPAGSTCRRCGRTFGAELDSKEAAVGSPDIQYFATSGTWVKPERTMDDTGRLR